LILHGVFNLDIIPGLLQFIKKAYMKTLSRDD
jgi:hypothetical protein